MEKYVHFLSFFPEMTHHFHSYSMTTVCHLDQYRSKEDGRNDLLTKKERKQVCQCLALSFLSKFTKVFELLVIRCLTALISSRIETK